MRTLGFFSQTYCNCILLYYFIDYLLMMYRLLQPGIEVFIELLQLRFRVRSRSDAFYTGDVVLHEDKGRFFRVQ